MFNPHLYLSKVKDHFKSQTKVWNFFAAHKAKEQEWEEFKNTLLKNAYRMSAESEVDLHERLAFVKQKLDIQLTVTMYQIQNENIPNAFISFQQNEAHLVFCGPILKLLQGDELTALIAHELCHIKLYTIENNDYQITNSIITAIGNDFRSENVFLETARYFRLYTEIFCDRGTLIVTDSEEISHRALIKIHTGLENANAANYLKQAKEILGKNDEIKSENDTHPENFIRVLALNLYSTTPLTADAEIEKLIEQRFDMDRLDIFRQEKLEDLTKYLVNEFTSPKWLQTESLLAMRSQYFKDFNPSINTTWQTDLYNKNVKEYFSYVLLDLAFVDPQLENIPLGRAFDLSEQLGFKDEFNDTLKKEKKLSDKRLRELQLKSIEAVSKVTN